MTVPVAVFELFDLHAGVFKNAPLFSPIEDRHVFEFETEWRPELLKRLAAARSNVELKEGQLQDACWDWRTLAQSARSRTDREGFALECEDSLQGLLILDFTRRARLASQRNQHLVYVDRVATAPQNRVRFNASRRFKGVGTVLMITAIQRSFDEGFKGRVALHALPQSDAFYRDTCAMIDAGPDTNAENMLWYEMTPELATRFLENSP